ncbi:MAG: hypothetical protein ACTSRZ_12260 [Promethearchaeota archaeon]
MIEIHVQYLGRFGNNLFQAILGKILEKELENSVLFLPHGWEIFPDLKPF